MRRLGVQVGQRLGQRERAFARRIDQPLVGAPSAASSRGVISNRLRADEASSCRPGRCSAAFSRERATSASLPSMPSTSRARVASGSVKLPRPQNQSITRSSRLQRRAGAARAPTSTRLICVIDLREVGRLERHRDAELGQRVVQRRPAGVERVHRVRALGLQPPLRRRASRGEGAQALRGRPPLSGSRWRSTSAVDARRRPPARSAAGGRAASIDADQLAQRQQQRADVRRQHLAAAHVGDVARLALVEADQHRALLAHVAHRQPGAVAVAPGRPFDRPQHALGLAPCRGARGCPRARAA